MLCLNQCLSSTLMLSATHSRWEEGAAPEEGRESGSRGRQREFCHICHRSIMMSWRISLINETCTQVFNSVIFSPTLNGELATHRGEWPHGDNKDPGTGGKTKLVTGEIK